MHYKGQFSDLLQRYKNLEMKGFWVKKKKKCLVLHAALYLTLESLMLMLILFNQQSCTETRL